MEIIKARNLKYDYLKYDDNGQASESYTAVEEINLDIRPGQFISILGHNGSGKSTLAKHMNALLIPTEGTIWVDEMDTAMEPELWKIRQKAGMVFQNPDNRNCSRRGCGIWTGKSGDSYRGDLEQSK